LAAALHNSHTEAHTLPRKQQQQQHDAQPQPYSLDGESAAGHGHLWAEVNPLVLLGAVAAVAGRGDGIILSYTSDMGACSITVLAGTHKPRFYPATTTEADRILTAITDWATENRT
jgi:hypothetical protein